MTGNNSFNIRFPVSLFIFGLNFLNIKMKRATNCLYSLSWYSEIVALIKKNDFAAII